jgi:hypothetical protein
MKFYRKYGALIIESEILVKTAGFLSAGNKGARDAKAAAFIPFVFVRKEEYATLIFINHERIHFRQQIETLIIGSWILHIIEDIYSRLFLKLKSPECYLYRAVEQEAYRNQHDMNYLKNRKWFSLFKYVTDKRQLTFVEGSAPEITIGDPIK